MRKKTHILFALAPFLLAGLASCRQAAPPTAEKKPLAQNAAPAPAAISLFITGQLQNTTEPCGCSSKPLGDVARIAALLHTAGERGLLLDAGNLRYKALPVSAEQQAQARLKADFLEQTWQSLHAVTLLQPGDLSGKDGFAELFGSVRLLSNVSLAGLNSKGAELKTEVVRKIANVPIGILGIADSEGPWPKEFMSKIVATGPATEQGIKRLQEKGARAIIVLTGLRRESARRLAQKVPGIDLIVAGGDRELGEGVEQAEAIGNTLLVVPAEEGKRLVRVDLHPSFEGQKPVWQLVRTPQQQIRHAAALRQEVARLQTRLLALRSDAQAEPAFLRTTEEEYQKRSAALKQAEAPPVISSSGYVTVELVDIAADLPRDATVASAMSDLDRHIGAANLQALSGPPPAPLGGAPSYVGTAGCQGSCHFHDEAVEFWNKTHHAQAFATLQRVGKELSYDCVSCHAVGFDEPGGSNLWTLFAWQRAEGTPRPKVTDLRNVQCEVCHGPGSLHIRAPSKNPIPIAKPSQERCLTCHTKDHSDTFDFVPYLRDILGPGHGEARRAALGNGPTGHELRSAALKRAANAH